MASYCAWKGLVQTGHGTELSLPVDHVMEVIREAVGGDPVQRHLRDGLLAFGAFALSFHPDDLRQELDVILTQRNIGVPGLTPFGFLLVVNEGSSGMALLS